MYEIKRAVEEDYDLIKSFLLEVPAIEDVEESILKNASVLYFEKDIYGMISYESFHNYALIRYFVYMPIL